MNAEAIPPRFTRFVQLARSSLLHAHSGRLLAWQTWEFVPGNHRTHETRASKYLRSVAVIFFCCAVNGGTVMAETINFDADPVGEVPSGWVTGMTGRGAFHWSVEADTSAPSKPNVLKQSGDGDFPWCVIRDSALEDGFVEVKFKPVSGLRDQAGGVVWRWKDANNYYVARANALENNVSLYYTQGGRRTTIKYVNAPVAKDQWHTLRIEFTHQQIRVALDGKRYIDVDDGRITGAGAVGVWTKADSVTAFDDFTYGAASGK
jgi:hypothetical protein